MNEPWLDEQHTWQGHWWLPDEPDDAVAGVLTYEPCGGLTLDLIGGFEGMISEEVRPGAYTVRDESGTWPVVHGVAANKEVTLLDCVPTHTMSRNFGAPEAQTIRPRAALVGVHLDQSQQAAFNECHISVEDLTLWSASSVFEGTLVWEDEKLTGKGTISVEPVEEPTVVVEGTRITLAHEHTLPHFEAKRGSTVGIMRDTAFLRFQPEQPWSLCTAQEHVKALQDLLSLATHRACGVLWLRLRMPPEERERPERYPIHDREVDVYSRYTGLGRFHGESGRAARGAVHV